MKNDQSTKSDPQTPKGLVFGRKKLGYRTPNRFRRLVQRRNPALTQRTRSLGGHR